MEVSILYIKKEGIILSKTRKILAGFFTFLIIAAFSACSVQNATANEGYIINPARDYLIVVNDQNPYDFNGDYAKQLSYDLIYTVDAKDGDVIGVEKATFLAFSELQYALALQGMTIGLYDAYRTAEQQQSVYDYYSNLEGWHETNKIAAPGYSEHHTGLLLNVLVMYSEDDSEPIWYTETAERQQTIPYFQLLHQTLADYGFIDRYPAGKEDFTGVPCEPYEIRYVGSPEVAHAIMDNGLCLEEYVASIK